MTLLSFVSDTLPGLNEIIIGHDGSIGSDYYQKRENFEALVINKLEQKQKYQQPQQQHNHYLHTDVNTKSYKRPTESRYQTSYRAKLQKEPTAILEEDIRPDILLSRSLSGQEDTTTGTKDFVQGVVSKREKDTFGFLFLKFLSISKSF